MTSRNGTNWKQDIGVVAAVPALITVLLVVFGVTRDEVLAAIWQWNLVGLIRSVATQIGLLWLATRFARAVLSWLTRVGQRESPRTCLERLNAAIDVIKSQKGLAVSAAGIALMLYTVGIVRSWTTSEDEVFLFSGRDRVALELNYSRRVTLDVSVSGSEECMGERDRVRIATMIVLQEFGIEARVEDEGYPNMAISTVVGVAGRDAGSPICSASFSVMLNGRPRVGDSQAGHYWHHWVSTYRGDAFEAEYERLLRFHLAESLGQPNEQT